jgi:lysozyme family protein
VAKTSWPQAYAYVRQSEGGNDDDKSDSGGRTSRGITQSEYDAWCKLNKSPSGDVWKASEATIQAIYYNQYWQPYCDALPAGIDYEFFDMSVNMGPREATIILQRTIGVTADGHFGVTTMAAVRTQVNLKAFLDKLTTQRNAFYVELAREQPKDRKFLKGWQNRDNAAELNAQRIASAQQNALVLAKVG